MPTTSVKLSDDLKQRLHSVASQKRRTPHWVMVEAINTYISQEEKRAAFYQEGLESWQEYQRTGEHVTWKEARSWMESWGTDNESEQPKCHK